MPETKDNQTIPSHIWNYMIEWIQMNKNGYKLMTNDKPLDQLDHGEFYTMFRYATNIDMRAGGVKMLP